jgi:hypothetical protein
LTQVLAGPALPSQGRIRTQLVARRAAALSVGTYPVEYGFGDPDAHVPEITYAL